MDSESRSYESASEEDEDESIWLELIEEAREKNINIVKKQILEEMLEAQNAKIESDMTIIRQRRKNYLRQQSPEIFSYFREEKEEVAEDGSSFVATTRLTTQPSCMLRKMRDFQLAGLNWMIRLHENGMNGILADEMGLGKTLQTISFLGFLSEFKGITGPHLVVVPFAVVENWIDEIRECCPTLRVVKFLGKQDQRKHIRKELLVVGKFDVCVTSSVTVAKEKAALNKFFWRYIVIDDAHHLKNVNSVLSKTMRTFKSNYFLLITGSPLQNNLRELWALLNFLLPRTFHSWETFEKWFPISNENDQQEDLEKLHKVLRPFLLRRLKSDVEKGLLPKEETTLCIGMPQLQHKYYQAILENDLQLILKNGGELKTIADRLQDCCNHPYLVGLCNVTDDDLVTGAGKMLLLDKLLPKLKEDGSRVLIFSRTHEMLDILEDYVRFHRYNYFRMDRLMEGGERDNCIEKFNEPGSDVFIFLLSKRAGGIGIGLPTADVIVLYDSDRNPQVDVQAQDRAHRIGQKKKVKVFRLCTKNTIEEKIIDIASKKLELYASVIQQGRLSEQKTVDKAELMEILKFGSDVVFSSEDSNADINTIIANGELDATKKKFTRDPIKFKMDGSDEIVSDESVEPANGEQKRKKPEYSKQALRQEGPEAKKRSITTDIIEFKMDESRNSDVWCTLEIDEKDEDVDMLQRDGPTKPRESRIAPMPILHAFQFLNLKRLSKLYEKEICYFMQELGKDQRKNEIRDEKLEDPLTAEERQEIEQLLKEGFSSWTREDFNTFVKAWIKYGRDNIKNVATEMKGKAEEEVERYAKVFEERYKECTGYIEIGEASITLDHVHESLLPLTKEEENDVLQALSNMNKQKKLVTHADSNVDITGEVLQCLQPGAWLNDEVINLYLRLLKEREKREPDRFLKCHFFNTFFYKKLISGGNEYDYEGVRSWTSQIGYCLEECEKIFVPIHKETHWCLAIIDIKFKKFQYLDALKGQDSKVLQDLANYYVNEVKDKSSKDVDLSSWTYEHITDLPAQKNAFDCGMFMIKYIDFYSQGLGLSFCQENMPYFRKRTVKEILRLKAT